MKEKITMAILLIVGIITIFTLLNKMEEKNYNDAIERCGSKDNLVINYTNQGDKYYSCKVER